MDARDHSPTPNVHDITHDVPDFINEAYQITYHMPSWHTSSVSPRLNCLTPGHGKKKHDALLIKIDSLHARVMFISWRGLKLMLVYSRVLGVNVKS